MMISGEIERKLRVLADKTQQSLELTLVALINEKYAAVVEADEDDFALMAADLEIRQDLARIHVEFAETELDGLDA